ncbi:MAG TPA: class I SAM-dependent methyltransferase [Planctomycetota bacterium]|nr:class I SAM-dependent methyltransferase [Planctomycetota bacterium]
MSPHTAEARANLREFCRKFNLTHPAHNIHRLSAQSVRAKAERYFKGSLIEIGCGTKSSTLLFSDLVERHVGIDIPDCYHDVSRVDAFATAYQLPFKDASFDCAYSGAVIEHLATPQRMVEETFRVLTPGGHAIFTAPQYFHLHEEPRDYFRFTKFGLEHMCREAGFEPVEMVALSGFLTTFGFEFGYWLRAVARGPLKPFARLTVMTGNLVLPMLDRGFLRREGFTWMNLAVVKKPK